MNLLLAIPMAYRLAGLFLLGAVVGGLVNWAIYRLAWSPRLISPWSPAPDGAAPRGWGDRLPIVGWLQMRREEPLHGRGFWMRPLLIEVGLGALLAWLYWLQVDQRMLVQLWELGQGDFAVGPLAADALPADRFWTAATVAALHAPFLSHALLIVLMTIASFIDVDEKTIPDLVVIPGALLGLALAALLPWSLLPGVVVPLIDGPAQMEFLQLASPLPWPADWFGARTFGQLALGLACYWGWCFALLPRVWRMRRGWGVAAALFWGHIRREAFSRLVAVLAVVGSAAIVAVWGFGGDPNWAALLTALVGMAAGGGLIWAVRLIGFVALRREAMGFGDVTLMAMIGAFLGWQPCLLIFFLAPLAGLLLGVAQWLLHRDNEIPYGPFLCLAALVVMLRWTAVWDWAMGIFLLGTIIPAAMAVCLVLMGLLLFAWQAVKERVFVDSDAPR